MNHIQFHVSAIPNSNAKNQIKNALDKIEGVQEVEVNAAEGAVSIGFNDPATENEIRNCIAHTGLSVI